MRFPQVRVVASRLSRTAQWPVCRPVRKVQRDGAQTAQPEEQSGNARQAEQDERRQPQGLARDLPRDGHYRGADSGGGAAPGGQ